MLHEDVCPVHRPWYQQVLGKHLWREGLVEERSCAVSRGVRERGSVALSPRGLESPGGPTGQGAGSCLSSVRDLPLWPTPSAIGQPAPSCPDSPLPIPGESSHPFREAPFLQKQRQTQGSGQGQAAMAWEQALG